MLRKLAILALALAPVWAQAEVSVVKIINFSCPFCKSSEAMDEPIRRAVEKTGGKMVYAALPADESSDGSRERAYYAARSLLPEKEPLIRQSLYKGAQDLGYPLATAEQTVDWLSTDLATLKYDWTLVLGAVESSAAKDAFARAVRLTVKSGAQVLPSYVVVKDGELIRTLDVDSTGGSYAALREAVLSAVEKAEAPSKPNIK